jgi:hypothetical protein
MGLSDANYPITKKVILTDFECKGFVDPGCHKSLLDESVYKKLDKTKIKVEQSLARIKPIGQDSKSIPASLKVLMDVTVFEEAISRTVSWEFLVVPGLRFDVVLGWDILREMGSNLDFTTGRLTITSSGNDRSIISSCFFGSIVMPRKAVVDPFSVKVVEVFFRSNDGLPLRDGIIVITEAAQRFAEFLHGTAVTVKDDRGLVFVFNNNEQLLKLHRREVLGNFVKVSEDEISACKVEIMNDKGRRSGREGSDNFESEPWSNFWQNLN